MNCTAAMDCMEDNPSQSGVAGSARDNPITHTLSRHLW